MSEQKKALGRGLGALLDSNNTGLGSRSNAFKSMDNGGIYEIEIETIKANPDQPRKDFDSTSLNELAESIKSLGIIQPITVRKIADKQFEVISGERRLRASQLAGLTAIPAFVREANDALSLELALVENIQRQDLNSLEIALSYQHLIQDCGHNLEGLAERVGKNFTTINNYLRLLKLPESVQLALRENLLSMGHARAIINLDSEADQLFVVDEILKKSLSVRQVEELVRNLRNKKSKIESSSKTSLPFKYQQYNNKLKKELGKNTEIKRNPKGKGSISIPFTSDQQLDQILQKLLQN
jgi:ParB family chromosome partitioning protein